MTVVRCPICQQPIDDPANEPAMPFCSPRCRQIDLGRWLGERNSVNLPQSGQSERDSDGESMTEMN
jgi:hypothetical protein